MFNCRFRSFRKIKKHCENIGFNKCNTCIFNNHILDICSLNVPDDWDIEAIRRELKDDTIKD